MKNLEQGIEYGIFWSRWLLAPLYVGLIAVQAVFTIQFAREAWHLGHVVLFPAAQEVAQGAVTTAAITIVLELIDMIMVSNLVIMVLIGGYATFVSKLDLDGHTDRPAWLDHIDPGTLKTKLAGALISISAIHLLQTFNKLGSNAEAITTHQVMWQVLIHATFIATTLILSWSDLIFERKIALARENEHAAAKDKAEH